MGVRESLNKNPNIGLAVAALAVVCSVALAFYMLRSDTPDRTTQAFYSIDDGKTWFAESIDRVAPFDHDGKPAVRARVFVCSSDGKQFVGYLERYASEYKKRLDDSAAAVAAGKPPTLSYNSQEVQTRGLELKKPGEGAWISGTDLVTKSKITKVICPAGGTLDSVEP